MLRSHNSAPKSQKSEVFEQPGREWSLTCVSYAVSHSRSAPHKDELVHKTHTYIHSGEKRNYLLFFLKSFIKDLSFALMKTTISRMPTQGLEI